MTTPTTDEIVKRIEDRKSNDPFGFEWHEYVRFLPFEKAEPYLKTSCTRADWEETGNPTKAAMVAEMLDYMQFAWDKANDCRGISCNRSVMHYVAWTWLAGDRGFSHQIDQMFRQNYCHYGKPILWLICHKYGWDFRQWDNDDWTSDECDPGPTADRVIDRIRLQDITIA